MIILLLDESLISNDTKVYMHNLTFRSLTTVINSNKYARQTL